MSVERSRRFQVRGAVQYAPGGELRLDFNDISPLSLGHTYVRWIELAVDVRFASAGGGNKTVPEPIAHNLIKSVRCGIPGGHTFFDLSSQAGESLLKALWMASGVRPESPGDLTVPGGGTLDTRLKIMLPLGYLPGAAEPDDFNVPLRELQRGQASIEINWANGDVGGDFDVGGGEVTVVASHTRIRQATIVMIARPEARVGPYLTWKQQLLSGLEERPLAANHVLHHLLEIPTANGPGANARTEVFITAAGRTQVDELSFDGINTREQVPAADVITQWNRKARTAGDRITQHELGTTEVLPIYSPASEAAKITHLPSAKDHPNLRVLGSLTTPRVIMVLSRLVDDRAFMDSTAYMGVQADPAAAEAKTLTKTALLRSSGPGAYFRVPRKLA